MLFKVVLPLLVGLVAQDNGVKINGNIWLAFGILAVVGLLAATIDAIKKQVDKEKK